MSHGNLSPRQKMINMMYLMLTAMLALNVSKQVLNAFVIVNEGLKSTNANSHEQIQTIYQEFQKQLKINEEKTKEWWQKANKVKKEADALHNYVQDLKLEIVKTGEGKETKAIEDRIIHGDKIDGKDNLEVPAQIMVGPNKNGKAYNLKDSIIEYKKLLFKVIDTNNNQLITRSIKKLLDVSDPETEEGENIDWESHNFAHMPLIGVITYMTSLQGNIRNAEYQVINNLYGKITEGEINFNKLEAVVTPNSNYIMRGGEYKAQVFLAARDTTKPPTVLIGDYDSSRTEEGSWTYSMTNIKDSLNIQQGKGIYQKTANRVGEYSWKGLIKIQKPGGGTIERPFKESYRVAKPNAVVSPTKMNVFYLGLQNPVDISVPGVAKEDIRPSMTNGRIVKRGNSWIATPSSSNQNCKVRVRAKLPSGENKMMGSQTFRVKSVPDPKPVVAGSSGGSISKSLLSAQEVVLAKLPNFLFDLKFEVVGFNLYTTQKGFIKEAESNSSRITDEQKQIIQGLSKGQNITFENIEARKPGGEVSEIGTVSFRIE